MKPKTLLLSLLVILTSCEKNNNYSAYENENKKLKKQISELNEKIKKYQDTVSSYNKMWEETGNQNTISQSYASEVFDCDNPELMILVEEKLQTSVENVMTISKNDELKTCDCEAYLPNKRIVLYRENKKNGSFTDHYKQGATFKYTAQLKNDGQILFNGNIE